VKQVVRFVGKGQLGFQKKFSLKSENNFGASFSEAKVCDIFASRSPLWKSTLALESSCASSFYFQTSGRESTIAPNPPSPATSLLVPKRFLKFFDF
jgi:hypothetical protein